MLELIERKPKPPGTTPLLFVHGAGHAARCWDPHYGDNRSPGHALLDTEVYDEVRSDNHPSAMVCGRDVVEALREKGYGHAAAVQA